MFLEKNDPYIHLHTNSQVSQILEYLNLVTGTVMVLDWPFYKFDNGPKLAQSMKNAISCATSTCCPPPFWSWRSEHWEQACQTGGGARERHHFLPALPTLLSRAENRAGRAEWKADALPETLMLLLPSSGLPPSSFSWLSWGNPRKSRRIGMEA